MAATPVAGTGGGAGTAPVDAPSALRARLGRPVVVTAVLVVVAILVRWVAWQRSAAIMNDGPTFLLLAHRFASGAWPEALAHPFHPLYPLLIAAVKPLFSRFETAGAAVSIASGGVAVAFLYDFLRRSFPGWPAVVGALLFAVHPYAVPFSSDVQSEGVYVAFFLGAVALGWRALEAPGFVLAAGAGLLSGLAYLTRPEGIGVALATGGVMLLLALRGLRSRRALALVGAGLALGAALVVAPYMTVLAHQGGELRLTRKKSIVAIATLDARELRESREREAAKAAGPEPDRPAPEPAWQRWSRRGGDAVGAVADVSRHAFRLDHWVIGALGVVAAGGPPGLRAAFLVAIVGLYGLVVLGLQLTAGYVSTRHVLPPLLPLLGYVALGVPTLGRVVLAVPRLALRRGAPSPGLALAAGLAILVPASTLMATRPQRLDRAAPREAAEWLGRQGIADRVAGTKQRDAYYARATFVHLPPPEGRGDRDWIDVLSKRDVRHVIVDESTARRYPGVGGEAAPPSDPRLRLLHEARAGGRWAAVLEITDSEAPPE